MTAILTSEKPATQATAAIAKSVPQLDTPNSNLIPTHPFELELGQAVWVLDEVRCNGGDWEGSEQYAVTGIRWQSGEYLYSLTPSRASYAWTPNREYTTAELATEAVDGQW